MKLSHRLGHTRVWGHIFIHTKRCVGGSIAKTVLTLRENVQKRNLIHNGKRKINSLVLLLFYEILSKRLLWQKKKTCLHLYHIYLNGINVCIALYITWQMMFYLLQGKYENISDALKYYKLSFAICNAMSINQCLHWTYKNRKSSI